MLVGPTKYCDLEQLKSSNGKLTNSVQQGWGKSTCPYSARAAICVLKLSNALGSKVSSVADFINNRLLLEFHNYNWFS